MFKSFRKYAIALATLVATALGLFVAANSAAALHPSVFTWSSSGASYSPTAGWWLDSPDGTHRAVFQSDGNWVVYDGSTAIWASNTKGIGIGLVFANGYSSQLGNVYISKSGGTAWTNNVSGYNSYGYMRMIMQNDGNFVEYAGASSGPAVWATNTAGK